MSPAKQAEVLRASSFPLYRQVMDALISSMEAGNYPKGSKLPSEEELCAQYGVSRITVRRALAELTESGILTRRQGKGTFVAGPVYSPASSRPVDFHELCRKRACSPSVRVLRAAAVRAGAADREAFKLSDNDRVVEIRRLCMMDGEPVLLEFYHFSTAYSYLPDMDLTGSLYSLLREYGIEAAPHSRTVSLLKEGGDAAGLMGIPREEPLLILQELCYDQKNRPLYTAKRYLRSEFLPLTLQ